MFKNILIATDGSDLAAKAVEQGVLFAKEIGAGITALTITEPFNVLSLAPSELGYTPHRIQETCGGLRRESARYRGGRSQVSRERPPLRKDLLQLGTGLVDWRSCVRP